MWWLIRATGWMRSRAALAMITGGRVIYVSPRKKLEEAFTRFPGIRSSNPRHYHHQQPGRKFRKIKLDVDNHDFKVLARKGYTPPKH